MALLSLGHARHGPIEAVLFDKDGTLSISQPLLETLARERILAARGRIPGPCDPMRLEALLSAAYGCHRGGLDPAGLLAVGSRHDNLVATATVLCQVGLSWAEALTLSQEVFDATDGVLHGDHAPVARLADGIQPLLEALGRAGVRCAVISNDTRAGIERFLHHHRLRQHFQAIRSADEHPRKPDPEAIHQLCTELGTHGSRCALVGDADSDLAMAHRAGVAVVMAYTAGWSSRPRLAMRHHAVHDWRDLEVLDGCR
jgi:phosphoglycolate phosphatase